MAAASDREEVALSSSELDDVLNSAGLVEGEPAAPEDDLELYGVWVKVKPQPLAQARKSAPPSELADLESAESAELTDDEQNLLAQLENEPPQGPPDLDMASLEVDVVADAEAESEVPSLLGTEELTIGGSTEESSPALGELSLEDAATQSLDQEIASLDAELAAMAPESAGSSAGFPALEEEEISLAPEIGAEDAGEDLETLTLDDAPAEDELPSLEEDLSLELPPSEEPADDGLPALEVEMSLEELSGSDQSLPSLEDDLVLEEPGADEDLVLEEPPVDEELTLDAPELAELTLEEAEPEPAPARVRAGIQELEAADAHEQETPTPSGEEGLPELDLGSEALTGPATSLAAGPAERQPDAAALILEKIEQELHAIRREISDLKGELTVLRAERDDEASAQAPGGEESPARFFAGEEDETIALTGDELDNILNTADVTEEKDSSPDLSDAPEALPALETDDVLDEDILEHASVELEAEPEAEEPGSVSDVGALRIPEEDLVDASGEEGLGDESSLLPAEPLEGLDLGADEPDAASGLMAEEDLAMESFAEVDLGSPVAEEPALPDDLAADLAADAEAAVAEPREDTAGAETLPLGEIPELELSLEPEAESDELLGVDLDLDEPTPSLETEAESDEPLGVDLDLDEPTPSLETEMVLSVPEELAEPEMPALDIAEPSPDAAAEELAEGAAQESAEEPTTLAKAVPEDLRDEIKSVLAYLDQLLEALPDEKIEEFAKSEYFAVYKKLFVDLGLEE